MAHPYTDKQGRTWQLDPLPAHNGYPGRPVIGYLCWVVATDPAGQHPGDFARTLVGDVIVVPAAAAAITAGQLYADAQP
jgi:hypothetical protein